MKAHTWTDSLKQIQSEIELVERELETLTQSRVRLVQNVCHHTLLAGGKRIRPALVLLAARASMGVVNTARAIRLGACLEMVHMATLIHDDVIDHAQLRRGLPTAAAIFGNTGAILSGDALLAKAMAVLADDGDLSIIRAVSESVVEMAEGEAREVETRGDFDLKQQDHFEILRMKTSTFVECACRIGAQSAGADSTVVETLAQFGHELGMAFQLVDDILDFKGDEEQTGKTPGTDLLEGCATLPIILLRDHLTEQESDFLQARFGATLTDDEIRMVVGWMESRGVLLEARGFAESHATKALEALANLPQSEARNLLESLVEFVMNRQY
ncbi:MAG: polyprenyl synthetase family protein [Armatimonadetes bacterium]|nr:polyprenyl synthetase family protein [Armatimonadota bacterium]